MLKKIPEKYKIVAVSDPDTARLKEAADVFGCRTYTDYNHFLSDDDIELVVVTTPSRLHATFSEKALLAGKHVLCEKPLTTCLEDMDALMHTAKKSGKILAPFQNRRYDPGFQQMRKVINCGKLGRIVMIKQTFQVFARRWDWQVLKEHGGGVLNNYASHFLDQLLLLFGPKEPEQIFCQLEKTITAGDAEDHVKIILKAEGQPLIDLEITHTCVYPQEHWLVMGTQGGLTGNPNQLKWKYYDPAQVPLREICIEPICDRSIKINKILQIDDFPFQEHTWKSTRDAVLEPYLYEDLYLAIREGRPFPVTLESVRRQLSILARCRKACPV